MGLSRYFCILIDQWAVALPYVKYLVVLLSLIGEDLAYCILAVLITSGMIKRMH